MVLLEADVATDLRKEFEYYLANQQKLVESYNGKYIVIRDGKVLGAYDSELAAVTETRKAFPIGSFLVQRVEPGTSSYTQTFHSRVAFS